VARRRLSGRDVNGILLLDKPAGMSSNAVLQRVKHLFSARKAGHTGSLDPIATGLLPICLGEATKVSAYLLDADKGYQFTCRLGQKTTTGDVEGEVLEIRPVPELVEADIERILAGFVGEIDQVPPMYSALKKGGQPLYKLARQGIEIERKARRITIYSLRLQAIRAAELDLEVLCSKGTYIRSLTEDIGEKLGCGAHVAVLRRTRTGGFRLTDAVTLARLEQIRDESPAEALDSLLLTMDSALETWPAVSLNREVGLFFRQGRAVRVPKAPTGRLVKVYDHQNRFLGVGFVLEDGRVAPKRLINHSE